VLDLKKSHYWPIHGSFSISESIKDELNKNSIKSNLVPLFFPLKKISKIEHDSYPKSHAILYYLVENQEQFYGVEYLELLATRFENTEFYLIGNSKLIFDNKNILNLGYLNESSLDELFKRITVYIRITEHDGLSQLILKSLSLGKIVITNTIHPFVNLFDPLLQTDSDLIEMFSDIVIKEPVMNYSAIDYINKYYDYSEQFNRYKSAFNEIGILL
jgi:hypothetical protein